MNTIVKVEGLEEVEAILQKMRGQVAFGASMGMNRTMDEAQTAIRQTLPGKFTLRRATFIQNTVYRKPGQDWATKDHLVARVRIHDDRNFLAKFEDGGDKTPTQGRKALGVPVLGGARPNKTSVVPEKFKLSALFFGQRGLGSQALQILNTKKKSARKGLLKASAAKTTAVIGDKVYSIIGTKNKPKLKLLWVFKKAVRVAPRLGFVATARSVINSRANPNIAGAIDVELARGLTTRSGPSSVS